MDPALFADDPDWASCVPEMQSGGRKCGMPDHEDCSPLDVEAVAGNLMPSGVLGGRKGYEARPGQIDMLKAVARAFNGREHLMIEAGTGVGKSLAYLVPAINWAVLNDTPVVVSTATRNLQSQLISNDIPRAVKTVQGEVRVALLKGRGNYLCMQSFGELMRDGYYAMNAAEREEFGGIVEWLHTEDCDGDLDAMDAPALRPRLVCAGEDSLADAGHEYIVAWLIIEGGVGRDSEGHDAPVDAVRAIALRRVLEADVGVAAENFLAGRGLLAGGAVTGLVGEDA